jgi:hypothetical protein
MAYLRDGKYWQKSIRRDGRVTSCYFGALGIVVAVLDEEAAEERRLERLRRAEAEEEGRRLCAIESGRALAARRMVVAVLAPLGFVQHHRHWRRRTMGAIESADRGHPPTRREVQRLAKRARAGEEGALASLAELARLYPRAVADAVISDLEAAARTLLADRLSPKDKAARLAVEARMEAMGADLAGPDAGPATKLAAALVAFGHVQCWAMAAGGAKTLGRSTPVDLRRVAAAHSWYLRSLKAYAAIRKIDG